jgi:hypothetical protein
MACSVKSVKLSVIGLSCLQKLISHDAVASSALKEILATLKDVSSSLLTYCLIHKCLTVHFEKCKKSDQFCAVFRLSCHLGTEPISVGAV